MPSRINEIRENLESKKQNNPLWRFVPEEEHAELKQLLIDHSKGLLGEDRTYPIADQLKKIFNIPRARGTVYRWVISAISEIT